jgi:hypothetical protein
MEFKETFYKLRTDDDIRYNGIAGTAQAAVNAILIPFYSEKLYNWFIGLITDGYWMVLLSPLILLYWIILTILYIPLSALTLVLNIVALLWNILFEYPASLMNNEEITTHDCPFLFMSIKKEN